MATLNIRISDDIFGRLGSLADKTGRTKTYYVLQALEEKLEELEDYYLAMQSLEKVNTGKSQVWSHQDIRDNRDLAN